MKILNILVMSSALLTANLSYASEATKPTTASSAAPIVITGDHIQPLSDTHWRIKVSYSEAVKVRCVAFSDNDEAIAIDSIAVIPPYSVSNMYTRKDDPKIQKVTCWITSTREEDLAQDYIKHRA
ncbi:hypothetical protein ACPV54_19035 [Vibrio mediterranei]